MVKYILKNLFVYIYALHFQSKLDSKFRLKSILSPESPPILAMQFSWFQIYLPFWLCSFPMVSDLPPFLSMQFSYDFRFTSLSDYAVFLWFQIYLPFWPCSFPMVSDSEELGATSLSEHREKLSSVKKKQVLYWVWPYIL
jgi:hypothetical protein